MDKTKKLNKLVVEYQYTKSDEVFTKIYEIISKEWRNLPTVASSIRADIHDLIAAYEQALLKCVKEFDGKSEFLNYYRYVATNERTNLYLKNKRYHEKFYEIESERDDKIEATIESIADEKTVESVVHGNKKADQLALIDSLLNGADETTTAIVEAFLKHPKPTATAIAKELGVHHSKVIRKLEKLAGKFDSKKYGNYRDFLVAI
ncbi:hypothetical protein [Heyndrickxia oleronia]|uniref:Sigma-70 family RNA polymerase sigma factor n=1 Tax=Heyndrickxia oleronia TaxID=38875 RepID=A0AAW6SNT7_9BACI|nr:hypothetical protein [Heyndrickxia oleronia]MDH5159868.1 hypothetical protein [Heyndrickxia oleronia]